MNTQTPELRLNLQPDAAALVQFLEWMPSSEALLRQVLQFDPREDEGLEFDDIPCT